MKIIKEGILPQKRLYKGTCYNCGTQFECEEGEGKLIFDQRDGDYLQVTCPLCKKSATASRVKSGVTYR